jgi:integrase
MGKHEGNVIMGRKQNSRTEAPIRGVTIRTTQAGNQIIQIGYTFKGKRYRYSLNVPPTANNIRAANRKLEQIRLEIQMGVFQPDNHFERFDADDPANQLLTDAVLEYMKRKRKLTGRYGWAESTYSERMKQFNLHIYPEFQGITLGELSGRHIQNWLKRSSFALNYGQLLLSLINPVVRAAVADGVLDKHPFEHVRPADYLGQKTTQQRKEEINPLSEDEVYRLLSVVDKPALRNYLQFMFFSGLRLQEGRVLRWDDVDLKAGTVHVRRAVGIADNREFLKTTKTGEDRIVDLTGPAKQALIAQQEFTLPGCPYVFPPIYNMAKSQYYWMTRTYIRSFWDRYLEKAGISRKHRSPKQTRHTFCSLMIATGKPLTWVAQQAGHTSLAMLEKHYAKAVKLAASRHQEYQFRLPESE